MTDTIYIYTDEEVILGVKGPWVYSEDKENISDFDKRLAQGFCPFCGSGHIWGSGEAEGPTGGCDECGKAWREEDSNE